MLRKNVQSIFRTFAMPSADTLSIPPIEQWAKWHLRNAKTIVDPFARNCRLSHYRNDLSTETAAEWHMDAEEFLVFLKKDKGIMADAIIFDPPYSPRQITEVYQSVGKQVTMQDTQSAAMYRRVRDAADDLLAPGGIALSFGWNSCGFGVVRNYEPVDMLIVCHGGAHNDTICVAERKPQSKNLFNDEEQGRP